MAPVACVDDVEVPEMGLPEKEESIKALPSDPPVAERGLFPYWAEALFMAKSVSRMATAMTMAVMAVRCLLVDMAYPIYSPL